MREPKDHVRNGTYIVAGHETVKLRCNLIQRIACQFICHIGDEKTGILGTIIPEVSAGCFIKWVFDGPKLTQEQFAHIIECVEGKHRTTGKQE